MKRQRWETQDNREENERTSPGGTLIQMKASQWRGVGRRAKGISRERTQEYFPEMKAVSFQDERVHHLPNERMDTAPHRGRSLGNFTTHWGPREDATGSYELSEGENTSHGKDPASECFWTSQQQHWKRRTFKMLKENYFQLITLYSDKPSIRREGGKLTILVVG